MKSKNWISTFAGMTEMYVGKAFSAPRYPLNNYP